jgi:hypothetical protein
MTPSLPFGSSTGTGVLEFFDDITAVLSENESLVSRAERDNQFNQIKGRSVLRFVADL